MYDQYHLEIPKEKLDITIENIGLPQHIVDRLSERKITTTGELVKCSAKVKEGYMEEYGFTTLWWNISRKSLERLQDALLKIGLAMPFYPECRWYRITKILPVPDMETGDPLDTPICALEMSQRTRFKLRCSTVRELRSFCPTYARCLGEKGMEEFKRALQKIGIDMFYSCIRGTWHICKIEPMDE